MSKPVSLFCDYNQQENRVTNYCGLIMRQLYLDSTTAFQEFVGGLLCDDLSVTFGPTFTQQSRERQSVPDLTIYQQPVKVLFENKLNNWFSADQIKRHAAGFDNKQAVCVLFLLSNWKNDNPENQFLREIEAARQDHVVIRCISYEDLVAEFERIDKSDTFSELLNEFKQYLDRKDLLPTWKYTLDVVNCKQSLPSVVEHEFYICPDTGGSYAHRRAKYLGTYSNKVVSWVFEVKAVVHVSVEASDHNVKWKLPNLNETDAQLIQQAVEKATELNRSGEVQVFLLRNGAETHFRKDSHGGLIGSKTYFNDIARNCSDAQALAGQLSGRAWSEYK